MTPARAAAILEALPLAAASLALDRERNQTLPVAVPTFRGAALEAQSILDMEWMLAGPAETGKTYAGLWRLDSLLRETPRSRAALVRKVRQDMGATVLQTWKRIIEIRGKVVSFGGERPEFYAYPNGARCYIGGMDDPGKVLSGEFDWLYVNQAEQLANSDWEFCTTRTTGRGVQTQHPMLFGDCNPGPPEHWLLKRKAIKMLHSKHRDNPTLYTDAGELTKQGVRSMSQLEKLTGVRRARLYEGLWQGVEGAVYAFDRGIHLLTRAQYAKIPIHSYICGVDFGYTNAFVWQRWGLDADRRMYLDKEIYVTKQLVQDLAPQIAEANKGKLIEATVCDHDAEGRAVLERNGILTVAAYKAVDIGIQNVQGRMAVAGDGKPRLYVVEDACAVRDEDLASAHMTTCTLEEFETYAWQITPDGKASKEEPVKKNDHGMDTTRYVAAHLDGLDLEGNGQFAYEAGDPVVYAFDSDDETRGPGDEMEAE